MQIFIGIYICVFQSDRQRMSTKKKRLEGQKGNIDDLKKEINMVKCVIHSELNLQLVLQMRWLD